MADTIENKTDLAVIDEEIQKSAEFQLYVAWKSLPPLMRTPPKQRNGEAPTPLDFAASMGIEDPQTLELVQLKTAGQFAERYGVHANTLTRWNEIIKERHLCEMPDIREWAKQLTSNVIMSMYNHVMKKGNPHLFKLWCQVIENWQEKQSVQLNFKQIDEVVIEQDNANIIENPIPKKIISLEANR